MEMDTENNVKERLNTLLHKKLWENEQKIKDAETNENESKLTQVCNGKVNEKSVIDKSDIPEQEQDGQEGTGDVTTNNLVLHGILNEKKKILLQHKDVIQFLQTRVAYDS